MTDIVNFRIIFKVVSANLYIISIALISCIGVALIYSEPYLSFVWASAISFVTAALFSLLSRSQKNDNELGKREAYLAVTISWVMVSLIGSLPYLFSGAIPAFINAMFESVSGFTTTGSSILIDIEALPKAILFWRSLTHWIGGIGIIVIFIIVMPAIQAGGYNLFTLESSLQEKIKPKIKSVGYRLLIIYLILTFSEILFLLLGGMNLYESVCHAFGTIATGGFSPKNTSIAGYSPYIQYVVMIFMLLAGTNYVIHYYLLKKKFQDLKQNEEVKYYYGIIGIVGLILTLSIFFSMDKSFEESFRESFFQLISIVTCTGYATADYLQWPVFAWLIIFLSMFLGGSTGSTAGGIKIARHVVLFKNFKRNLRQVSSRFAVLPIRFNGKAIGEDTNGTIISFITLYIIVFCIGTVLMMLTGIDAVTASSSVATSMAGIGPGMGTIGPVSNFAHIPEVGKIILTFLMLVGRLEIYTIIMIFTPHFWYK